MGEEKEEGGGAPKGMKPTYARRNNGMNARKGRKNSVVLMTWEC